MAILGRTARGMKRVMQARVLGRGAQRVNTYQRVAKHLLVRRQLRKACRNCWILPITAA